MKAAVAIWMLSCGLMLASCNSGTEPRQEMEQPAATATDSIPQVADGHDARNSLDVNGIYQGVLPCADCEGIETRIELMADNRYVQQARYLGKKDAPLFETKGSWEWENGSIIRLVAETKDSIQFFVGENKLIQLDQQGKRIEGALAEKYVLTKTN
jgi:uncharacterized lipoprotein NlpE involved in copper resistance